MVLLLKWLSNAKTLEQHTFATVLAVNNTIFKSYLFKLLKCATQLYDAMNVESRLQKTF